MKYTYKTCSASIIAILLTVFLIAGVRLHVNAQISKQTHLDHSQRISASLDTFKKAYPTEKLFIHTDKPYYASGDTLWFKSYLFNAKTLANSALSGLLYAEIITDSGQVVKRISVPVKYGLSWGQIVLDEDEFKEGSYTLRAYTNWMQNFGDEYFFNKRFYITNVNQNAWLVKEQHRVTYQSGAPVLNFALQLSNPGSQSISAKNIQIKVMDGKKILSKNLISVKDGRLEGSFKLPEKLKGPVLLSLEDAANHSIKSVIPLTLNEVEDTDLQFMPESGYLIAGIPSRVGFKALGANGEGQDITGKIFDSKHSEVAVFKSVHKGMGIVDMVPQRGETYSAEIMQANGQTKTYPLPAVKASGTALRIDYNTSSDSIRVSILLSEDLLNEEVYQLMGFSNEASYYGAKFNGNRQRIVGKIAKNKFPTGVVHFTLFNSKNQPLNERIVFINHNDNLKININSDKSLHTVRDSVPVYIEVKDTAGKPVKSSFSLAVTDDAIVKPNTFQENILSRVFLTSDLKGAIESPAYYFNNTPEANLSLDALMLTQGWVGYDWPQIFKPVTKPQFKPESEFKISGRVLNAFNKPLGNAKLTLMSMGKYRFYRTALTEKNGRFEFKKFQPMDTTAFFIQAKNLKNQSFNVKVEFDKFVPAKLSYKQPYSISPWYVNSDSTLLEFVKIKQENDKQQNELVNKGRNVLNNVVIVGKHVIKKSKNLNGPGEADQIIDEKQMQKDDRTSLLDIINGQVKGFHSRQITHNLRPPGFSRQNTALRTNAVDMLEAGEEYYFINDRRAYFIIDGIRLDQFFEKVQSVDSTTPTERNQLFDFLTEQLDAISATDITGLEVMSSTRYTNNYETHYLSMSQQANGMNKTAYIEITTRSGAGPLVRIKPGVAAIRPLPLTWPKEFYKPRYTTANINSAVIDYRSTIHWDRNVYCDESGKGFTSFYAADRPGTYTVIVQGSNMAGLIGYQSIQLEIGGRK